MKKHIFIYLFLFTALITLITYINGRKYQEAIEKQNSSLSKENRQLTKEKDSLWGVTMMKTGLALDDNPEAENILLRKDRTAQEVIAAVNNRLLELNLKEGGNPAVPYIGMDDGFKIDVVQVVNHKWVIANFTDGDQWGEVFLTYAYDDQGQLQFTNKETILYDKNRG